MRKTTSKQRGTPRAGKLTLDGGESASALNLTEVEVTNDRMRIRSAKVDGTVFDGFAIDRDGSLPGK